MLRISFWFLGSLGLFLVLYMSWLPQPALGSLWFMPVWLAKWVDANENNTLRTGVPFVLLGAATGAYELKSVRYWWLIGWLGLMITVILAEMGQLFLPNRSFDWKDIAWGGVGSLIGLGIGLVAKGLSRRLINYARTL